MKQTQTPYQMMRAIDLAEQAVLDAEEKYLRRSGWEYTCQTHGSYWFWKKTFPEGVAYFCGQSDALSVQRAHDSMEANCLHQPINDGDDFCTICGGEVEDHEIHPEPPAAQSSPSQEKT